MLLACLLFLAGSLALSAAAAGPALRRASAARAFLEARQGLLAVLSVSEDVAYRRMRGITVDAAETLMVGSVAATAETASVSGGLEVSASASGGSFSRASTLALVEGEGVAFRYGVQAGEGGIVLENSSSVAGNVFSNGPIVGAESNVLGGEAISAGSGGRITGVHATSSVWAHTILDSDIDGDAHYQSISGTTVDGTLYPGSTDQATSSLAISDTKIAEWKADAEAGGVISSPCPYKITDTATLGPKKIACDMEISGTGYTLTLGGPLWVAGNLAIKNSPTIKVAASLGAQSVALIADNPTNRTTSSKISSDNSAVFEGSGNAKSSVLLLSQNRSAEESGNETAIYFANSAQGALLAYAGHGEILLQNSVSLREASAYRIRLKNTAKVTYKTGIANLLFSAGPGGGYSLGSWKETE